MPTVTPTIKRPTETGTIRIVARLVGKPHCAGELRALAEGLVKPTRAEAGCVSYELFHSVENPAEFVFIEEWADGAAVDRHMASAHFQRALERVGDLLQDPADIRPYTRLA